MPTWSLCCELILSSCTRIESLPTWAILGSAPGITERTACAPGRSLVVLTPEMRNSEPPVNSSPRLRPRVNSPASDTTIRMPEMAYQILCRRTTSIERSPV